MDPALSSAQRLAADLALSVVRRRRPRPRPRVHRVDEEIVPVLRVADAPRAVTWYRRLGFEKEWEHQFEPGLPRFVSVARDNVRLYLSEHEGDARPDGLVHLYVRDIEAVSKEFGVAVDEEGLAGRECHLVDPDGNRLRVAARRSSSSGGIARGGP